MSPVVTRSLLAGAGTTLEIVAAASLLAAAISLLIAQCRLSRYVVVRFPATVFLEFFRGTSALVQLFWAYYVLPLLGVQLPAFEVGFLVLGMNAGAYGSEIVRGAMLAIPKGQLEASKVLSLSPTTTLRYVTLPQALRIILPPAESLLIDVLKASALVSLITVNDFTGSINGWASQGTIGLTPAYSIMIFGYLLMSAPLSGGMRLLARRANRHLRPARIEAGAR